MGVSSINKADKCANYYRKMIEDKVITREERAKYDHMFNNLTTKEKKQVTRMLMRDAVLKDMKKIYKDGKVDKKEKEQLSNLYKSADSVDKNFKKDLKKEEKEIKARGIIDNAMKKNVSDVDSDNYIRDNVTSETLKYAKEEEKGYMLKCLMDGPTTGADKDKMIEILKSVKDPEEMKSVCKNAGGEDKILDEADGKIEHGSEFEKWITSSQNDADKTDQAHGKIREKLLYDDMSEEDLMDCVDILKELSPEERNEVISKLSDAELDKLTDKVTSLRNEDDRREVLDTLIEGLDGKQLARVVYAKGYKDEGISPQNENAVRYDKELFSAIARKADPKSQIDLIKEVKKNAGDKYTARLIASIVIGFHSNETHKGSNGDLIAEAMKELDQEQITDMMSVLIDSSYYDDRQNEIFNSHYMIEFLKGINSTNDIDLKAKVFNGASIALNKYVILTDPVQWDGKTGEIKIFEELNRLLDSGGDAIIFKIVENDAKAEGFAAFAQSAIKNDRYDTIANVIKKCEDKPYQLGYYTKATAMAFNNQISDEGKRVDKVVALLGSMGAMVGGPKKLGVIETFGLALGGDAVKNQISDKYSKKFSDTKGYFNTSEREDYEKMKLVPYPELLSKEDKEIYEYWSEVSRGDGDVDIANNQGVKE